MSQRFTIDRELVVRIFFFAAFAFLLTQAFLMAQPFLPSVLVASILAIMFHPVYRRVERRLKKPALSALLLTFAIILAGVLPLVLAIWTLIRESADLIPVAQNVLSQMQNGNLDVYRDKIPVSLMPAIDRTSNFLGSANIDLKALVLDNARELALRISAIGAFVARNAILMLIKVLILVVALFFMFRDGEKLLTWVIGLIPMEKTHKQAVARTAYETFWAVTIGVFLTAAAQGVVAFIGFLIAGTRMPVLLGIGVALVSLLGASFLICIPVALFTMMDNMTVGVFLLIWGAVLVGWLDNLLKPMLIGSRARMPFVLVFVSILGGIKLYGPVGLLLGPIVVACVLTFIRIFQETYGS